MPLTVFLVTEPVAPPLTWMPFCAVLVIAPAPVDGVVGRTLTVSQSTSTSRSFLGSDPTTELVIRERARSQVVCCRR